MPDATPEPILARAQLAAAQRPAGPQGRDRAPRSRPLHRVVAARAALAAQAAAVRPRRAGRIVALGALPRLLRRARLGGPRAQPAQPLLVADRRPGRRSRSRRTPRTWSRRSSGSARRPSSSATGWAACWRSRRPSASPMSGLVLISSELPRDLRAAGPAARAARDPRGLRAERHRLGDAAREAAPRPSRPDPRRRAAHPAPAGPEAARSRRGPAADAGRRLGRPAGGRRGAAAGHRRRARPRRAARGDASGWPTGSARSTSRSARIRTTA